MSAFGGRADLADAGADFRKRPIWDVIPYLDLSLGLDSPAMVHGDVERMVVPRRARAFSSPEGAQDVPTFNRVH
jgi:hypothetical protein